MSSGFINLDKITPNAIVHAAQRAPDEPASTRHSLAQMEVEEEAQDHELQGGNFNTFGEHAPNIFTQIKANDPIVVPERDT